MSPNTQRALITTGNGGVKIASDHPVPKLGPEDILVKVRAVTLNPTDWKHAESMLDPGSSIGCDFSGDVVEIGSAAQDKGVKVGDAVAGFIHGGANDPQNGTFQEYVKIRPELVWHKPASLSYEDASSMGGIALSTTVQALLYRLNLPKPWSSSEASTAAPNPVLIWAGSTSTGLFAVELAKLANPRAPVITTASPRNHALLKSLGADAVFDYKDPDVSQKIKDWVKENGYEEIEKAYDTISEYGSRKLVADSFGPKGGKIISLDVLHPVEDAPLPAGITAEMIIIYTALDPSNKDFTDMSEWYAHLPALITERGFKNAIPLEVSSAGLDGIAEGLQVVRAGTLSAKKLAYTF